MKQAFTFLALLCLFISSKTFSQTSGIIVRPVGGPGPAVLDTNLNGYTSITTAGFGSDDINNSEIHYKVVPALLAEPTGDLLRGPTDRYSDIVKTLDGSGFYLYNDGANLLCRIRMGGIVSGSKGYSVLLDTDGKFGATGPNADPNYQAATTGINGNPGFEREIVFETNFRIAVYNADGTSTPTLITSYPLTTNSQISIAATRTSGDEDFFYDFYVPYAILGITGSTPIRAIATTVMSPQAAIGGPKSDIYGLSGDNYMDDWTAGIISQPPFTVTDLTTGGTGITAACTEAPFLDGPILPTATTVTGTWTKSTYSSVSTATITLYNNGVQIGTPTSVNSGNTWSINVSGLANNDVITAKAQAAGESMCLASNAEIVKACNSSNSPATPILGCTSGSKGLSGTNLSTGWTVHVDNITRSTVDDNVTNLNSLFGATTGSSPNINWPYSGGCSSGAPLTSGSYKIYYTDNVTGCSSQPAYFCAAGNGPNALAGSLAIGITTPSTGVYTPATTTIAGTTITGATVSLYINGLVSQTTTAAAGAFSFSGITLLAGQTVNVGAEYNTGTVGTSYCAAYTAAATVVCYTNTPIITVGNSSKLIAGSPIAGTSSDAAGTTIRVYTSANVLVATTSVQVDGTWSTGNVGTTPGTYNAVNTTSYYANAQNGSCGVSGNSTTYLTATATSAARCGTITGPVTESATSVSGTLTGTLAGTVVTLYVDDISVGAFTTANTAWGPIAVNTTVDNTVYAGAVLTIGITEPSKTEVICGASVTVSCAIPTAPTVSPLTTTVQQGGTVNYTITSPQANILYSLRDSATDANFGASKFGSGGSMTLLSSPFNVLGNRTIYVRAISFSGANCQSFTAARVTVAAILPIDLVSFEGKFNNGIATLQWSTAAIHNIGSFELQRSYTAYDFKTIETINAGNTNYIFNDPSVSSGIVYYRLMMVDKNTGAVKYSKIITLHINRGIMVNSINPVPFTNTININLEINKDQPLVITLCDMAGRKIKNMNYAAKSGINNITVADLNSIAKGVYMIELNAAGENISRQLVIKQ